MSNPQPEGIGSTEMDGLNVPFDRHRLDELMGDAGIDLVLASSKHNVQYLLGGYRFFFFRAMDAIGLSRYLPAVGYQAGRPEASFYVAGPMEQWQLEQEPAWTPTVRTAPWSTQEVATTCADLIAARGLEHATIALEFPFLPSDALRTLGSLLPGAHFVDAVELLEETRAVKSAKELALIRRASSDIVNSMASVIASADRPCTTKDLAEALRREETDRGLSFDYCLIASGGSLKRAPSSQTWDIGSSLSLDSGANLDGYIGDLARMAVLGPPTQLMIDLLAEIDSVQMAARREVRPGASGDQIYQSALSQLLDCPHKGEITFEAHGQGLVSHEAPHLSKDESIPAPVHRSTGVLRPGMVLSIETTLANPVVGFVKLEDTVAVTRDGHEAFGDFARGWNIVDL